MTDTADILLQNLSASDRNALIGTAQTFRLVQTDGEGSATVTGAVKIILITTETDDGETGETDISLSLDGADTLSSLTIDADIYLVR